MREAVNRRQFLTAAGLSTIALTAGVNPLFARLSKKLNLKIAYSSITRDSNDAQTIADLASLGYRGIQLRSNTFGPYRATPSELKALLGQHHLTLAMFSSSCGNVNVPAVIKALNDINFSG